MPDRPELDLMYQAVAARRLQWDNLLWQVPVLSLTAQAFLFATALGADVHNWARALVALLSLIISVLSILLMGRHRQGELIDAHWLERYEQQVLGVGPWVPTGRRSGPPASSRDSTPGGWVALSRSIPCSPSGSWASDCSGWRRSASLSRQSLKLRSENL